MFFFCKFFVGFFFKLLDTLYAQQQKWLTATKGCLKITLEPDFSESFNTAIDTQTKQKICFVFFGCFLIVFYNY